jgi:serine/threonine-protein kinase
MFEPETTDERSDLFSLAAVAYFALTGRSPFEAESLEGLYFAIEGAKFARPSELRPELPEAVDAWFERALARDRDERWQTAHAMANALLEAVLAGASSARIVVPIAATTEDDDADIGPVSRSVPGLPRRGIGRSAAVVAAAAMAVGVWVWRSASNVTPADASTVGAQDAGLDSTTHATPMPAPVFTSATVKTATSAAGAKRPPARVQASRPAPPVPVEPPATLPAEDPVDPDVATTSIRELIGNEPKPDLDP